MKNRILTIMNLEGMKLTQMASLLGIQNSTLSNITGGRNKPSFAILSSILTKFPNLNFEWLMNGKGNPYKDPGRTLRGEIMDSEQLENMTKDGMSTKSDFSPFDIPPTEDELTNSDDYNGTESNEPDSLTFGLFSELQKSKDTSEQSNSIINSGKEHFHPYPAVEKAEFDNTMQVLQSAKNLKVNHREVRSYPSENSMKQLYHDTEGEKKERTIAKIVVFYTDGTFEEVKPSIR